MSRLAALLVLFPALAACGPNVSLARAQEESVYDTEYAAVWNAAMASIREEYPRLAVVDAVKGNLVSDWHLIERVGDDQMSAEGRGLQQGGRYFRMMAFIRPGGPPWKVEIDGEAALFRPGMAMITPYRHDGADEPPWVKVRIDKVRARFYQRLQPHARKKVVPVIKPGEVDPSPWNNLPPEAARLVAELAAASTKKDSQALRTRMSEDFVWSLGGAPGIEPALALWNADPMLFSSLRATLDAGCSEREQGLIVCPSRGGGTPGSRRVELRTGADGRWRFAAFHVEE
jgi:hypothetical protein